MKHSCHRPLSRWPKYHTPTADHLSANLLLTGRIGKWWIEADQWRQRYADNKVALFSWSGLRDSWPNDTAIADYNRQAFGEVMRRPPATGAPAAQTLTFWTLYSEGSGGPQSPSVGEFNACIEPCRILKSFKVDLRPHGKFRQAVARE